MKESKTANKKENKAFSKIKQNIALVLVFVLVFAYMGIELNNVLNVKLETRTAVVSTVYDIVEARALVIRNEKAIENETGAVTMPYVENGEKVKIGGRVAMQFASEEGARAYADYLELQKELDYYREMEKSTVGHAADVQSLDKDILQDLNGYIRANVKSSSTSAREYANGLNDKLTRRQILIGEKIDFSSIIQSIEAEMKALGASDPTGYFTTDTSGMFMQYTDGFEDDFDYSDIENLNAETLNGYIALAEKGEETNNVGKIVSDFDWYFCSVVSADKLIGLQNGDKLDVTLKNSDNVINCKIVTGAEIAPGQKESVLVLKCSEMNAELASLRVEDIEIRVGEHTGVKMPLDAVRVKDGEKGVYALVASVVEWRRADILYTGEDYVILSDNSETDDGIKLYDEIIVRGKELHDGKVYT